MERPQKKPRLGLAPYDESDDDDELNYEPEEITRKRDPNARLARSRANAAFGLKSAFESIFKRYERDFEGVADEIDLFSGDIVIDNRHLQRMRNEKDMGLGSGEVVEEGISLHDGDVVAHTGNGVSSSDDEDEDQILQGRSSALVRKAPGALVPSVSGQRPGLGSLGGPPQLPPFGASPLFFGSWGPPGAMEPAWQAPQLQIPQFKSSFGANLFTGRYQLPAREASKSIWGPGSGGDEDEDEPHEAPRMRLAPPTRRVPARPKAMKLVRNAPPSADESGDEGCILMGVDASLVLSTTPTPPPQQLETMASADGSSVFPETDSNNAKSGNKTKRGKEAVTSTTSPSLTITKELAGQLISNSSVTSQPSGKKSSPANKRRRGRPSQPRKSLMIEEESQKNPAMRPAESAPITGHSTSQTTTRNSSKVLVVEIRSYHPQKNHDCLDFLDMTDLPVDSSPSLALPDDSVTFPSEDSLSSVTAEPEYNLNPVTEAPGNNFGQDTAGLEANIDQVAAEPKDNSGQVTTEPGDATMLSDRTIPDSQEQPVSLPSSSAPKRPMERPPERPRQKKKKASAYDLSDEEVGFLSRPAQRRKHTSNRPLSATNEEPVPFSTAPIAPISMDAHAPEPRLPEPSPPSASELTTLDSPGSLISPVKLRSARAKTYSSSHLPHRDSRPDEAKNPVSRVLRKRKLTPSSLSSAEETGSERLLTKAGIGSPLSVAPISRPLEKEAASNSTETTNRGDMEVDPSKPMADAVATSSDDPPRSGSIGSTQELSTRRKVHKTSAKKPGIAPTTVPGDTSNTRDSQSGVTSSVLWGSQTIAESRGATATDVTTAALSSTPSPPGAHLSPALGDAVSTSSTSRMTRRRAREAATSASTSSEFAAPSFTAEASAGSALDYQLPDEGREPTTSTTPRRELRAKISAINHSSSQPKPATPSRTPKNKLYISGTPNSAPSTGHRFLTSLVPEKESHGNDSEDELTASSLWSLFQKPTPVLPSSGKSLRRERGPEATPTRAKKRVSAVRLSSGLGPERPSGPDESVMRTPGGTIRKCGERGLKCGKDFCFTCC